MNLQLQGHGANDNILQQVDRVHGAGRVSLRPAEYGTNGGSYSIACKSGVMAAGLAANSPILAFRWASSAMIALIRRIQISAGADTTAFAAGAAYIDLFKVQGFTAQDTGGGAVAFTASKTNTKATRFPATQLATAGGIQLSATATLTAGTRTKDTNPLNRLINTVGAVPAGEVVKTPGILYDASYQQPLELAQSEGFVVEATVPATGTWLFSVNIDWDEVDTTTWLGG